MKFKLILFFSILSSPFFSSAQKDTLIKKLVSIVQTSTPDTLQARIILIGDAGEFTNGKQPVINGIKTALALDAKTTIVYLGDNIYHNGLPDETSSDYPLKRAVLDSQIQIADNTKAKVYFIPGNHDWNYGDPGGLAANQAAAICR
ncbi:MAG: metallophosphoesterase family protein [Chitinophagaceae bacterium]